MSGPLFRRVPGLISLFICLGLLAFPIFQASPGRDRRPELNARGCAEMLRKAADLKTQGRFKEAAAGLRELTREPAEGLSEAGLRGLFLLGLLEWDMGNVKDALGVFSSVKTAGVIAELPDLKNDFELAVEIIGKSREGIRLRDDGDLELSKKVFEEGIALSRKAGVQDFEIKILRHMSFSYWEGNEFEEFRAYNQSALDLAIRNNNKREQVRCLNNIGGYYFKARDFSAALASFDEAYIVQDGDNDLSGKSMSLFNMGLVYVELGSFDRAWDQFKRGLELDVALGNALNLSSDYINIGLMKFKNSGVTGGRALLEESAWYLEQGLGMLFDREDAGNTFVDACINLGVSHFLAGDLERAGRYLRTAAKKAEALGLKDSLDNINLNLGDVCRADKQYDRAKSYYRKVIERTSPITGLHLLIDAYYGLGLLLEADRDYREALSAYYRSLDLVEKARSRIALDIYKAGFARDKFSPYQRALDVLFGRYMEDRKQASLDEILSLVERTKARAFFESLMEARSDAGSSARGMESPRMKSVSRSISAAVLKLASPGLAADRRRDLEEAISAHEEEYLRILSLEGMNGKGRILQPPGGWSLARLRKEVLDDGTALLEYFLGEERSFALLVTRDSVGLYQLPGRADIEKKVRVYLRMLSSPETDVDTIRPAALALGRDLAGFLTAGERENLLIIPDGILHHLPFESLALRKNGRDRYLVEDFNMHYAPSASALALIKSYPRRDKWRKTLLAFGAPDYSRMGSRPGGNDPAGADIWREVYSQGGFHFSPLPFSREEVRAIAENFNGGASDVFTGGRANEAALKSLALNDYQILHFACHSFLDEKNPTRSALVISPNAGKGEDGFFQARELYGLEISADLVVLSACQSGNGTLEAGEGLLGLPRLFFYAGARSVLSALWYIGDRTTAGLMKDFYRYLRRGESKSRALRLAQLEMVRSVDRCHPFYWAGYVLSGDPAAVFDPE